MTDLFLARRIVCSACGARAPRLWFVDGKNYCAACRPAKRRPS